MKQYGWAVNEMKLMRAIAKGGDEEATKKAYIEMGGLIEKSYADEEVVIEKAAEEVINDGDKFIPGEPNPNTTGENLKKVIEFATEFAKNQSPKLDEKLVTKTKSKTKKNAK